MSVLLEEALKRREDFLKEHPKYREDQRNLEVALSGVDDPIERIGILMLKISENMKKINKVIGGLNSDGGNK